MTSFLAFMAVALLINVIPGPAMLHSIQSGSTGGARVGLAAALGVESGVFVYVIAAVTGLSTVLVTSPSAYRVVQVVGIAFLTYLMISSWPRRGATAGGHGTEKGSFSARRAYLTGVLLNITNPKIAVFFLAVLPQFVPAAADGARQLLTHGLAFNASGLVVNGAAALVGYRVARQLSGAARIRSVARWLPSIAFLLLVVAGVWTLGRSL